MSKADLYQKLKDIKTDVETKGGGKDFRVQITDAWEHRLVLDVKDIAQEIRIQLAEITRPDRKATGLALAREANASPDPMAYLNEAAGALRYPEAKIIMLAELYVKNVVAAFRTPPRGYETSVESAGSATIIVFRKKADPSGKTILEKFGKEGPVYSNLRETLLKSKLFLFNKIKSELKLDVAKSETFFNVGHVTAVAEIRAGSVLSQIQQLDKEQLAGLLNYSLISDMITSKSDLIKKFQGQITFVKPQSVISNNVASNTDGVIIAQLEKAIAAIFKEMDGQDWANQAGSSSIMQAIAAELLETAAKRGAKVQGTPKKDYSSSKAEIKNVPVKVKTRRTTYKAGVGPLGLEGLTAPSRVTLSDLIPLINANLAEVIRSKMGISGRLVNRTGRFSESAQVISIDPTSTLSYTYMQDPYGVFESQGPRDPRPLIESSIREIALGLTRRRFSFRRI